MGFWALIELGTELMSGYEEAENAVLRFAKEIRMDAEGLLKQGHHYAKTFQGTYAGGLYDFPKWFEGDLDQAAD